MPESLLQVRYVSKLEFGPPSVTQSPLDKRNVTKVVFDKKNLENVTFHLRQLQAA